MGDQRTRQNVLHVANVHDGADNAAVGGRWESYRHATIEPDVCLALAVHFSGLNLRRHSSSGDVSEGIVLVTGTFSSFANPTLLENAFEYLCRTGLYVNTFTERRFCQITVMDDCSPELWCTRNKPLTIQRYLLRHLNMARYDGSIWHIFLQVLVKKEWMLVRWPNRAHYELTKISNLITAITWNGGTPKKSVTWKSVMPWNMRLLNGLFQLFFTIHLYPNPAQAQKVRLQFFTWHLREGMHFCENLRKRRYVDWILVRYFRCHRQL